MNSRNSTTKPGPPGPRTLAIIYAIWLGTIVAIFTTPSLMPLGTLAGILILFVWLPWWTRANWSTVVDDLPATYATISVSLLLLVALGLRFHFESPSIAHMLVQAGWLAPRDSSWLNLVDYTIHAAVFFSTIPAWRWFRRVYARTPAY